MADESQRRVEEAPDGTPAGALRTWWEKVGWQLNGKTIDHELPFREIVELLRIDVLEGIVRDLAADEPLVDDGDAVHGGLVCGTCGATRGHAAAASGAEVDHEPACPWLRARAFVDDGTNAAPKWTESTVDAFARALADGDPDGRLGKDGEGPPPCPRCGGPTFKVQIASLSDAPDSDKFVWGHDCEPETFSDMAPGWRL